MNIIIRNTQPTHTHTHTRYTNVNENNRCSLSLNYEFGGLFTGFGGISSQWESIW